MLRLSRWSNVRQSLSLVWKSCVVIDGSMEKGSRRACSSSALSASRTTLVTWYREVEGGRGNKVKVKLMGDSRRKVNDDSVSVAAWFDGFGRGMCCCREQLVTQKAARTSSRREAVNERGEVN
jgi:hypothetical protein